MKKVVLFFIACLLVFPVSVFAVDQADLMKKIEDLSKQLENLKQQMQEMQKKEAVKEERITQVEKKTDEKAASWTQWFELGGDYRFRYDYLKGSAHEYMQYNPFARYSPYGPGGPTFFVSPMAGYSPKNDALLLNRFGLNLKVQPVEDISFKGRLLMYKVWGHETAEPIQGNFFADRAFGPFDGSVAHVPSDNALRVDQAYVTWSNIANQPVWFSIGRRPSTGGAPGNLRQNTEKVGTAGVPNFLVDYAFDGLTLGVAPDIDALPGAYAKFCYGKGYDSGYSSNTNIPGLSTPNDVNFIGFNIVPYDTEDLHVELQWSRAISIFTVPPDGMTQRIDTGLMAGGQPSGSYLNVTTPVKTNLGDIDQFGLLVMGKVGKVGPGVLNLFAAGAMSLTHPNDNLFSMPFGVYPDGTIINAGYGLLYDQGNKQSQTGYLAYAGARYDILSSGTKIGLEYNYGSKYWITFVPAADDMWTGKLGTRGNVIEGYIIQELNKKPIAKRGKAYLRLGYQYYSFNYTGSNNWLGDPKKINDLNMMDPSKAQMLTPLKNAHDLYLTLDVTF